MEAPSMAYDELESLRRGRVDRRYTSQDLGTVHLRLLSLSLTISMVPIKRRDVVDELTLYWTKA